MASRFHTNIGFYRQLSTTFVFGILTLSLVSSSLISLVVSQSAEDRFISQGIQMTNSFASQSRLALLYGAAENARLQAETLLGFPDVSEASIFLPDQKPLLVKGEVEKDIRSDWTAGLSKEARLIHETSDSWFFAARVTPSFVNDGIESELEDLPPALVTLGYVRVAMSKDRLHVITQRILFVNILIAISLASVLLVFLRFITKKLTTPLENLSGIMKRAENGETQIRAALEGPKDIVDMEKAFNSMMSVLEQRESELKDARDAALKTAKAKAEFAAVVSHEIRTPLNGVLGMLNLLNEGVDPERQKEYLNVAISSGDTLMVLINDILDFSKIDAGKLEIDAVDFNLRDALEDVAALFAERAQSKDIELSLDIPPDLPRVVAGDVTRLRQILNNLLSNAIKFTDYGEVILSVCFQELEGHRVLTEFSVRDTGIGIPVEARERIFEAFRQASTGTTRNFGGTGLGLTICKRLVELLGGELRVESSPNGSTFAFSTEFSVKEAAGSDPCLTGQRMVVAVKNPTTASYLKRTLESFGCECRIGRTEQEVLSILSTTAGNHGLVFCLLDPGLCESDFSGFIRELRQSAQSTQMIKIIILTRPNFYERDGKCIDATLDKPVRMAALKRVIRQIIDGTGMKPVTEHRDPKIHPIKKVRQVRILIVDDNRFNQQVAKAMVNESGYQADIAADGQEAVRLVADYNYGLILMDCNMPVMDGYDATLKIRSLPGDPARVPIFAMTAVDNPSDIRRCLDVGMNDFLIKPINLQALRKKLAKLFNPDQDSAESSGPARTSSIDDESFENLVIAIGHKVGEIIDVFFGDTPNYLDQVGIAHRNQDWVRLKSVTHSLKGSAHNLGANILGSICREIEELVNEKEVPEARIESLIGDLRREYSSVERNLRHKLESLRFTRRVTNTGENKMVLVVDDDRGTRLTITNALEKDGLLIEQAGNGQQAIDKFIQFNPELIIMDAIMPVMDGFEASKKIKQLPNGRQTEILIVTGLENDESVELAFDCGATDFIPKPINYAVLRQRVKRILDARQSAEIVQKLASTDSLTKLPNRVAFQDRLLQDIAYARRNGNQLAVMFIDIDHFKDVNDNLGHAAGDELLKLLAKRVGRCVRTEDTLARLGGDEFVVVLSSIRGPDGAVIVAQHILKALSAAFFVAMKEIYVSASIGISIFPDDGNEWKSLLKNADTAMYRAKAVGRNNYQFYTREMSALISERVEMESDLRRVIHNDELTLYYQPKVDLRNARVVGAEALVRWKHPRRGFLPPNSFIPIAEETGLINEIGAWCMVTACKQFKSWQDEKGFTGRIAVNSSVREFMSPSFVENVRDCLRRSGLSGECLEIEITESAVLECGNDTVDKLNQLANMGVTIAIDDFGVGNSAFSYLKRLKVQVLKIDRSFIRDVPEDRSGAAVIDGMIQLAHKLNLQVVAEGVEYQSQYDFLKQHDCDLVQGYLIGKPMPSLEFYNSYVLHNNLKVVK
ncbi:MAG: EAL domain-containing protein [Methylococcaceae bacterium]|nr:EAL domain-containing protein [Methylococcaceae bacterium]